MTRSAPAAMKPRTSPTSSSPLPITLRPVSHPLSVTSLVASRIGQIEEVIEDGRTGLLCQPGDADDLYRVISRLRQSSELRDSLAGRARDLAHQRFTWARAGEATAGIIRDAINRRAGRAQTIRFPAAQDDSIAEAS